MAGHLTTALYASAVTGANCAAPAAADVIADPAKSVPRSARISWWKNAPGFPGRLMSAMAALT